MSMKPEQNYDDNNNDNNSENNSISTCQKLKLLFWKNWILQWNRKMQILVAVILPIIFVFLIVSLRVVVEAISEEEVRYPSLNISDLSLYESSILYGREILYENGTVNIPKHILCYTPYNNVTHAIIRAATVQLRLIGWLAYDTPQHMEDDMIMHNYIAGIHFISDTSLLQNENGFPIVLNFTLRFPSELRTMQGPIIETWQTNVLFPIIDLRGPRNRNASDGGVPVGYLMEGFLPIQHAITMSWLHLAAGPKIGNLPEIRLQRFPYTAYIFDPLLFGMEHMIPFLLVISFIYPCTFVAKYITSEKELQLKEIMKLMGLHNWLHWTAWFVKCYILLMSIALLIMILLLIKFKGTFAILTNSHWFPLLIFFHCYVTTSICFCFMMAVFFSRASTAAAITGILWFFTYFPYTFTIKYYESMSLFNKLILSCLFSNTALGFGFHVIISMEVKGEGVQLKNLLHPVSEDDSLTLFYVIIMLILSGIIYMAICLYVEQIYPGAYGVPRRWNYPFCCNFWREIFRKCGSNKAIANISFQGQNITNNCKRHRDIGVQLVNLEKCYGQNTVVKNLNLKLYRNEITVLLGHNGSGKTTTLHMLTGIIPPTNGTALVNGWDIRTQLERARQSMGICPQHNVLFNDMSVRNHIVFFSRLKGVRGSISIREEVDKYMRLMELEDKSYVTAGKLSGGMKRKLSLCCALCGNTRVVLCDEPSSGIDAAGRRLLWDLLLAEKTGRTVLLTTHYMDEANILGDRIAILGGGELKCYGTPFELKKQYGLGYRLVCVMKNGCDVKAVTNLMAKHIPNIKPESTAGSEIIYRLPYEYSSKYAALLNALDRESDKLKLDGYGISVATIEDVFVQLNIENELSFGPREDSKLNPIVKFQNYSIFDEKPEERNICNRFLMHWQGLLYKNMLITLQNYLFLILQLALPIIFLVLVIINSKGDRIHYALPEMHVSLKQYQTGYIILDDSSSDMPNTLLSTAYAEHIANCGKNYYLVNTNGTKFEDFILERAIQNQQKVDFEYLAGLTISKELLTIWLNNKPLHTAPLTLNLLHNGLARQLLGEDAKVGITNGPLPYSNSTLTMRLNKGEHLGIEIAINLTLCMCFITAFFILPVVKERETRAKLLQYVTGIDVCSYWMSQWLWDFFIFTLTALISIITIAAFQELGYSTFMDLSRYLIILLVFGTSVLPLTYVTSMYFHDGATGLTRMIIFGTLTGTGLFVTMHVLSIQTYSLMRMGDKLAWYFRIFPHFCLANGLHRIHIGFNIRQGCKSDAIKTLSKTAICNTNPICCNIPGYFSWQKPGVLPEIVYLLVTATCSFLYLIIVDTKLYSTIISCCNRMESNRSKGGTKTDKDGIEMERIIIKNMSLKERDKMPLIVDSISKRYGKLLAVNKLSFYVDNAECFGLLGINGAGKTSTFQMLTGDTSISSGTAFVQGLNLRTQMGKVRTKIGYCPQFDALFEELTGRQTLRVYCLLQCIPRDFIKGACNELAKFFGFEQHIDKKVKHYSGGNKRKLSVAIAFIGNPLVLYLDEPTCGMDPIAQRQLWQILSKMRNYGKATVLTTHSMDECEALCTRIAIMIRGEIKCIGSIQQIKNNYSEGQILKIKVKIFKKKLERKIMSSSEVSNSSNESLELSTTKSNTAQTSNQSELSTTKSNTGQTSNQSENNNDRKIKKYIPIKNSMEIVNDKNIRIKYVKDFIARKLPRAVLKEEHNEQLTYYLPINSTVWSEVFQLMESNRNDLHIEDYVITQSRLEEIFLNFVWNKK